MKIGDTVQVASRVSHVMTLGEIVDIIPKNDNRQAMFRVRFFGNVTGPTLTPTPNEMWVDAEMVHGPFLKNTVWGESR